MSAVLVLDLDETLLHWRGVRPLIRWYVREFFEAVAVYDLAVWSAADPDFVAAGVEELAECGLEPVAVWDRRRCVPRRVLNGDGGWYYRKPLVKMARALGRSLDDMLVVDDDPRSFETNYGNGVQVRPFEGQPDDELLLLAEYLVGIRPLAGSFRRLDKRHWRASAMTVRDGGCDR